MTLYVIVVYLNIYIYVCVQICTGDYIVGYTNDETDIICLLFGVCSVRRGSSSRHPPSLVLRFGCKTCSTLSYQSATHVGTRVLS